MFNIVQVMLKYSVKIFNPLAVGGSTVVEWTHEKFLLLKDMLSALLADLKDHISSKEIILGYITPGHSFKGKQMPLTTDEELSGMYDEHCTRRGINLWVKLPRISKTKRPRSVETTDFVEPVSKKLSVSDSKLQKMDELQEILEKLKSNHQGSKYSPEQLHCWANLIQMNKHDSYDNPPNKPFFGKQAKSTAAVSSPGKRIELRTQCIDQLTKWHKLKEDGVIADDEYQAMHKTIMNDIKKF